MKKAGSPPGTLVASNAAKPEKVGLRIAEYTTDSLTIIDDASLEDCFIPLENSDTSYWIEVNGVHDVHIIEQLGAHFKMHPLLMEDILFTGQRCKLDEYGKQLFIVMRALGYNEDTHEITDEQVSLLLGKHYVITFMEDADGFFAPIRERLKRDNTRLRSHQSDYMAYALIDCLVDHYYTVLEKIDDRLEHLEQELIHAPGKETLDMIQRSKRAVTHLRKSIWPMRDVISQFKRMETSLITAEVLVYMQDVYDHIIQAIDTVESFRDLTSGMLDIYLSNINQRMNEIMKVLTVVSTIFVPITFIASIYGMNFDYMPELHYTYGYPGALLVMLCVVLIMLCFFRKRRWI